MIPPQRQPTAVPSLKPSVEQSLRLGRLRLYAASFLVDTVSYSYSLVLSAHAREDLRATPAELGLLGTAATSVYALCCLFTGGWSDKKGSVIFINTSLFLMVFLVLPATLLSHSIFLLCLVNAGYGLCLALFWPPLLRELSLLSPGRTLWRSLGVFNISWAAGVSVGSPTGPASYKHFGLAGAVGLDIALISLALLFGLWHAFAPGSGREASSEPPPLELVEGGRAKLFLYLAWTANFCVAFALGGLQYEFLDVSEKLGFGLIWGGVILCAKDVGRFAAFAWLRFFSGWHYSLGWLVAFQLAGGAALVASGFVTTPGAFLALFPFLGLYSGLAYYSSIYYGLNLRKGEGKKSGAHEGILALGLSLGPVFCGQVANLSSGWPQAVLVFSGLVVLAGLLIEWALWLKMGGGRL